MIRVLLACLSLLVPCASLALPFGGIGGPADSLLRVESGNHCDGGSGGPMCVEAIGSLGLADYSLDPQATILALGNVDHAAGEISGLARFENQVGMGSSGDLWLHARDQFTVTGGVLGESVSVTGRFRADGVLTIEGAPGTGGAEVLIKVGPGSWNTTNGGITGGNAGGDNFGLPVFSPTGAYAFDIEAEKTFDAVVGTPIQVLYAMRLSGNMFDAFPFGDTGAVDVDSLTTGELSFDLPAGYGITSQLGFGVPEPGAAGLLVAGCLGLAFAGRRRSG